MPQHPLAFPKQRPEGQRRLFFEGILVFTFAAALACRLACIVRTADLSELSSSLGPMYTDVAHSQARILMPSKVGWPGLAGLLEDSPACGTLSMAGWTHEQPAWALPDDNSALIALGQHLVCFLDVSSRLIC